MLATSTPRNSLYLTRRRKPVPRLISLKYSGLKKKKKKRMERGAGRARWRWQRASPLWTVGTQTEPLVRYVPARLVREMYECARAPANGAQGNLRTMEKAKCELRVLGDMCVFACGKMWRVACSLWCQATGSTRPEEPGKPSELHGPTAAMRATAIPDLGNVSSRQNALATVRLAKAAWIASGRSKGSGSEVWDDTQRLVRSLFDSLVKRNTQRPSMAPYSPGCWGAVKARTQWGWAWTRARVRARVRAHIEVATTRPTPNNPRRV